MKKILSLILCLSTVSCSSSITTNVNIPEINVLKEEAKINIDVNKYKGNFVLDNTYYELKSNYTSYTKPSITINEDDKGFINIKGKTYFISQTIPIKDVNFNLKISPYGAGLFKSHKN